MTDSLETDPWQHLRSLTPARIGLGRTGAALRTRDVLEFALAHARARDAVDTALDTDMLAAQIVALGHSVLCVRSAAPDRATYLRRPDLGRRLSPGDVALLREAEDCDIALVVADGLSSTAVQTHAVPLLAALQPHLARSAYRVGPVVVATQARVALADEVGVLLRARLTVILIGERPGLSSPDSLGLYLTLAPKIGCTDAGRNCISNVRPAGLGYDAAAHRLFWLIGEAFRLGASGVALKDASDLATLAPASSRPELR